VANLASVAAVAEAVDVYVVDAVTYEQVSFVWSSVEPNSARGAAEIPTTGGPYRFMFMKSGQAFDPSSFLSDSTPWVPEEIAPMTTVIVTQSPQGGVVTAWQSADDLQAPLSLTYVSFMHGCTAYANLAVADLNFIWADLVEFGTISPLLGIPFLESPITLSDFEVAGQILAEYYIATDVEQATAMHDLSFAIVADEQNANCSLLIVDWFGPPASPPVYGPILPP
jgi:hypothetical protein